MAKPPFPWIGSKEKIAPYILQLFPPKLTQYVEPFGGSGAVLLALPPDPNRLDIYNDLDAELVNLFSCIKECSNVLLRELKFLPIHGRKLFEYYRDFVAHKEVYFQNVQAEIECLGDRSCFTEEQAGELLPIFQERLALYDVKRAAAYYLAIRGSFSGTINSFGVKGLDVERFLKLFPPVSARLKDVPLENKNALQLIRERDKKGSLMGSRRSGTSYPPSNWCRICWRCQSQEARTVFSCSWMNCRRSIRPGGWQAQPSPVRINLWLRSCPPSCPASTPFWIRSWNRSSATTAPSTPRCLPRRSAPSF